MHEKIPQTQMIHRIQQLTEADENIRSAMLYGSFALGEADRYSDIDCMLYIRDEKLEEVDPLVWIGQVQPVLIYYVNEFGNHAVVYENFVRAEFHFEPASKMPQLESFQGQVWFPAVHSVILTDKTGELRMYLQKLISAKPDHGSMQEIRYLGDSFCNWMLFGCNVFARGETARAMEILNLVHANLLRLVRISTGSTQHWITPTRRLEHEIPEAAYHRFQTCTAGLARHDLKNAYLASWSWGTQLLAELYARHHLEAPSFRLDRFDVHLTTLLGDPAELHATPD